MQDPHICVEKNNFFSFWRKREYLFKFKLEQTLPCIYIISYCCVWPSYFFLTLFDSNIYLISFVSIQTIRYPSNERIVLSHASSIKLRVALGFSFTSNTSRLVRNDALMRRQISKAIQCTISKISENYFLGPEFCQFAPMETIFKF